MVIPHFMINPTPTLTGKERKQKPMKLYDPKVLQQTVEHLVAAATRQAFEQAADALERLLSEDKKLFRSANRRRGIVCALDRIRALAKEQADV